MKVLVTGGAGFIGSHTVDRLIEQGAQVIIIDDLSTGKERNLNPAAEFVKLDITSGNLEEVFLSYRPEFVIHLAAQVSVAKSVDDPIRDCMINIIGLVRLLESCRKYGINKVVYASSAAVYGNPLETEIAEAEPTEPLSFYGISKMTPEYYLRVFNHLYGLGYTVLRYANVYGPRQDAAGEGGVVSIFATKVIAAESTVVFGDGEQTRDFVYVEDVARANVKALSAGDQAVINIGTGVRTSINELYEIIAGIVGTNLKPAYTHEREGDIKHSCLQNNKALTALNWKPEFSLKEGLTRTLDFYESSKI